MENSGNRALVGDNNAASTSGESAREPVRSFPRDFLSLSSSRISKQLDDSPITLGSLTSTASDVLTVRGKRVSDVTNRRNTRRRWKLRRCYTLAVVIFDNRETNSQSSVETRDHATAKNISSLSAG